MMFIPTKDVWHRHRLDRNYLNAMRPRMFGCPKCGKKDGLNFEINPVWNFGIECTYHIKCDACGYEPTEWYDNIADAVLVFDTKARNNAEINNNEKQ
ncbi:MAG: hypothetical protein IJI57_04915 [Flexilinea sp.]|nr:hypothetical protein [Flexilinea sp.]